MSYYNTTNITSIDLKQAVKQAETQENIVLQFFKEHPDKTFTPFDVLQKVFHFDVPITSVRRAITDLEQDGFLEKTSEQRLGSYGKLNYCWKLKNNFGEKKL